MTGNLFTPLPCPSTDEVFEDLLVRPGIKLERIVSMGQATPADQWLDQEASEWVVLLQGRARLRFEQPDSVLDLRPGDYVFLPPHCRHRVDWTPPGEETVWLALHLEEASASPAPGGHGEQDPAGEEAQPS